MARHDNMVLAAFLVAALGFGTAAVRQHAWKQRTLALAAQGRYNATSEEVMGRNPRVLGAANSRFTLVEFGDYQCGPCRATEPTIKELLKRHTKELRLVFRDLPLTQIHPLAMRAAVVATRAGSSSDFWSAHDQLYGAGRLTEDVIRRVERWVIRGGAHPLSEEASQGIVREAMAEAESLSIGGTPSFVLVCPGGVVRRVERLDLVVGMLRSNEGRASARATPGR